jgi:hypothetical protein
VDLRAILGTYAVARGGPPYHPTMMTALLLYAYAQGIRSSRKIARACEERDETPEWVKNKQQRLAKIREAKAALEAEAKQEADEISADTGYCSEANLATVRRRRIRGYVATGRQRHGSASATESEHGERGPKQGPLTRAMRARLRQGGFRSRYRLRKQTVEPVFGQMKACRGFRQFLLRGLAKVKGEWKLACIAHNLLKLLKVRAATA